MLLLKGNSTKEINTVLISLENRFNKKRDFSTEEINTGDKFFNNNEIYRTDFLYEKDFSNKTITLGTIKNFQYITKIEGVFEEGGGGWLPLGCAHPTNTALQSEVYVDGNGNVKVAVTSERIVHKVIVSIYYTKNTN